jgi:hypothetical protein
MLEYSTQPLLILLALGSIHSLIYHTSLTFILLAPLLRRPSHAMRCSQDPLPEIIIF